MSMVKEKTDQRAFTVQKGEGGGDSEDKIVTLLT